MAKSPTGRDYDDCVKFPFPGSRGNIYEVRFDDECTDPPISMDPNPTTGKPRWRHPAWSCSCPSWTQGRMKRGDCKHIIALLYVAEPKVNGLPPRDPGIPVNGANAEFSDKRRNIQRRVDIVEPVEG